METQMHIERMKLDDLTPANYNPRVELNEDDDEYQKIKASLEQFGYVDPIIYNKRTNTIVGGHQRYTVLKDLGYDEADVSVVDLDEQDEKALNVALNKVEGEWDRDKLKELLSELEEDKLTLTGFDEDELDSLLNDVNIDDFFEEEEKKPERQEEHDTKLDRAIELLKLTHDKLGDVDDYYKDTDLYQAVEYFLEEE
ncbi:ParB N-terminal domain-containing protein [Staphylococcus pettenkoferi]|uniref:ParB N-terminal domain-containing protein n=1 Tax=Staphylococcus pettenkoferi TaxID=170573 RepID=A0ABT4BL69_9STAP|nr:ParB N-terminal domain-containing protein [Staphylococcus pettenkoferi]MCY1583333.1 ParB N-terminal domain-containing protein [Staphylococcus pettenkoferi]